MADETDDGEDPIAWRGVAQDTPVRTSDGEKVGTLSDMLGSDQEDIFHGIVVHLGRLGHHVFVPADLEEQKLLATGKTDYVSVQKMAEADAGDHGI